MAGGYAEAPGAEAGTAPLAPGDHCGFAVGHGGRKSTSKARDRFGYCLGASRPGKVGMPLLPPSARDRGGDNLLKQCPWCLREARSGGDRSAEDTIAR